MHEWQYDKQPRRCMSGGASEAAVSLDVWHVETEVQFAHLNAEAIRAYIATGEPRYALGPFAHK